MSALVLAPEADPAEFCAIARGLGWTLVRDTLRMHHRARQLAFRGPLGEVTWTEHHPLGLRYISAGDPAALAQLAALPTLAAPALIAACADPEPTVAMPALLALSVAEPEEAFFAALAAHAVHPNIWVRRNARFLCQYLNDPRTVAAIRPAMDDPELGALWRAQVERIEGASPS